MAGNGLDDDHDGYVDDIHGINVLNHTGDTRDNEGHGTHVAGTIGAVGNNGIGVAGINWNVQLLSVKIFSADDSAGDGAVEGYEYLLALKARGVNIRVVNNSWGGPCRAEALAEAIRAAEAAGILSVCSAGNDHHNSDERPDFPAGTDIESLISVAASMSDDRVAYFSNYGALSVDLAAPGDNVLSTYRGGHYMRLSGTSMSSPHVSGAAALLLAQNGSLTPAQIKALLMATVDPLPQWQGRVRSGGRLNVGNAMARLVSGPLPVLPPKTNDLPAPFPRLRALAAVQGPGWEPSPVCSRPSAPTASGWRIYRLQRISRAAPPRVICWFMFMTALPAPTRSVSRSNTGELPNADCADVRDQRQRALCGVRFGRIQSCAQRQQRRFGYISLRPEHWAA